jgi:hypothetical protein
VLLLLLLLLFISISIQTIIIRVRMIYKSIVVARLGQSAVNGIIRVSVAINCRLIDVVVRMVTCLLVVCIVIASVGKKLSTIVAIEIVRRVVVHRVVVGCNSGRRFWI